MPITKFLQEPKSLEIEPYKPQREAKDLKKTHVPFSGSPQKHPCDSEKFILVVDPYCPNTFYYEFENSDVEFAEELPNIVDPEGNTLSMARIWVKRKSIALRCTPFMVDSLS